jgi:hypothetical protein
VARRSIFYSNRVVNVQKSYLWAQKILKRGYQVGFGVNVWDGIVGFLSATRLVICIKTWRISGNCSTSTVWRRSVRQRLRFQHDKSLVYCGKCVRQWLNLTYPGRCTWRRGPNTWPPPSPDLTPMDFFLCKHLKEHAYLSSEAKSSSSYWTQLTTFRIKTEIESSPRNVVLNKIQDNGFFPKLRYLY